MVPIVKRHTLIGAYVLALVDSLDTIYLAISQYETFDYFCWVLLAFMVIRLLKTENPHWWLGIGAAIGLGMMTKYTIAFSVVGFPSSLLAQFQTCTFSAAISMPFNIQNEETINHRAIYVCHDLRLPWPEFWKNFQYFG